MITSRAISIIAAPLIVILRQLLLVTPLLGSVGRDSMLSPKPSDAAEDCLEGK